MKELFHSLRIQVNENLYLKDPETSELGRRIITFGIKLIHQMGLETFTFKKLADAAGTTEASVYRYFENKQKMLVYLASWFWGLQEYRLVFATNNLPSPAQKISKAIQVLTEPAPKELAFPHIQLQPLHEIVLAESFKAFLTKEADQQSREGYFDGYRRLCQRLSVFIHEVNPKFENPVAFASTIIEGLHMQMYFSRHLPGFTDLKKNPDAIARFFETMAFATLQSSRI